MNNTWLQMISDQVLEIMPRVLMLLVFLYCNLGSGMNIFVIDHM